MSTPTKWQYFSAEELTCHCGCGRMDMDDGFMQKIVAMRRELGFPFVVTSGFRCPEYNQRVSNTGPQGPHTTGHAMDINVHHGEAAEVLAVAKRRGITGLGLMQKGSDLSKRFIHMDDLQAPAYPRPNVWTY